MAKFIFVSNSSEVWDMNDDGTWGRGLDKVGSIHDLMARHSGAVYEFVADITKLPNPEPKKIGHLHKSGDATYLRFTSEDLPDPWICTRTGVRFSWHHLQ